MKILIFLVVILTFISVLNNEVEIKENNEEKQIEKIKHRESIGLILLFIIVTLLIPIKRLLLNLSLLETISLVFLEIALLSPTKVGIINQDKYIKIFTNDKVRYLKLISILLFIVLTIIIFCF